MATRLKHLGELSQLREQLAERARAHERQKQAIVARRQRAESATRDFSRAMDEIGVRPLAPHGRHVGTPEPHPPHPAQRLRDEHEVLAANPIRDARRNHDLRRGRSSPPDDQFAKKGGVTIRKRIPAPG